MNIEELAFEYHRQYNILSARLDGLEPLLFIYTGTDLDILRKRMKRYYTLACQCEKISCLLQNYYQEGLDD